MLTAKERMLARTYSNHFTGTVTATGAIEIKHDASGYALYFRDTGEWFVTTATGEILRQGKEANATAARKAGMSRLLNAVRVYECHKAMRSELKQEEGKV